MRLKTNYYVAADFIYSNELYGGFIEGSPDASFIASCLNGLKKFAKEKSGCDHIYVHNEPINDKKKLLPVGNVALLDDMDRYLIVIWFDYGDNPKEALEEIANTINWKKLSKEYIM